jgi:molybdopterin-guanine dinucleotide biosynthesis protein B
VGWSGSGKTTLIEELLPHLARPDCRVGYLKSDVHGLALDPKGKDTDRVFRAGACRVGIASPDELMVRTPRETDDPRRLLERWFPDCDLVVVEGFKDSDLPKIEVVCGEPVVAASDPKLLALVSKAPDGRPVPRIDPGDPAALAAFVRERLLG